MNWIPPRLLRILAVVSALGAAGPSQAQNETEVDLALVLAVDVSRSMDDDEQRLQRDGFVGPSAQPPSMTRSTEGCSVGSPSSTWNGPARPSRRSYCPGP